jgi:hypothetical protein
MPWLAPIATLAAVGAGVYSTVAAGDNVDTLAKIEQEKIDLQNRLGAQQYALATQQINASIAAADKQFQAQEDQTKAQAATYSTVLPLLALLGGAYLVIRK